MNIAADTEFRLSCALATSSPIRRVAEQIRPDLALFERRQMDTINPPRQEPRQIGLAHAQGKLAQILAVAHQHIERLELDLGIVPARVQPVEVGDAVDAQQHRLAVDYER